MLPRHTRRSSHVVALLKARACSSSPTRHIHDAAIVELAGGGRMTLNDTGIEMSEPSPLLRAWVQSYDGVHPLVDVGCAYGRNVAAASKILAEAEGHRADAMTRGHQRTTATSRPMCDTHIVACDCDDGHLASVERLRLRGVETAFARLPDRFPPPALAGRRRASGILLGEILHFLDGDGIERALRKMRDVLVPGGLLAVTACSPFMNFAPDESGHCPVRSIVEPLYQKNAAAGERWPVGEGVDLQSLLTGHGLDGGGPQAVRRMPTFFHPFAAKDLRRSCEDVGGFDVIHAVENWHPGYPPQYKRDGRENVQLLAVKK